MSLIINITLFATACVLAAGLWRAHRGAQALRRIVREMHDAEPGQDVVWLTTGSGIEVWSLDGEVEQ